MDLIDREETLKAMDTLDKFGCDENCRLIPLRGIDENSYVPYVHYDDMVKAVKGMPSAQKTGRWIHYDEPQFDYDYKCSECGYAVWDNSDFPSYYCPNCGAYMKGEQE